MTGFAAARLRSRSELGEGRDWLVSAVLLVALAAIVGARWLAVTRGLDGLLVGLGFGGALSALWLRFARRDRHVRRVSQSTVRSVIVAAAAGMGFGLGLVLVTVVGTAMAGVSLPPGLARPAAPFLPWAVVTLVVATAEEGILRGALFDRLRAAGCLVTAVAVTTIVFALMHVPLYGWHVVPLDLAVGLGLAGLRLATRSIVAAAVAHTVADLATWWL